MMNPKHVEGRGTHTAVQTGTIQSDDTLCFFFPACLTGYHKAQMSHL